MILEAEITEQQENLLYDADLPNDASPSGYRWQWRKYDARKALHMQQSLGISDLLARLLSARNISYEDAEQFLEPKLKYLMPNPFDFQDMEQAVDRVIAAINSKEKIAIFGDYDVDGATSSALLANYFDDVGANYQIYIPDRQKEGYGPNATALCKLYDAGAKLAITVDCGCVAFDALAQAKEYGLDVVVIDHHICEAKLPSAVAVVNPNRLDESGEYGYLAAVGVSFLFLVALNSKLREAGYFTGNQNKEPNLMRLLDIVALGTVCDVVPLVGLNRALVKQGLKILASRNNTGICSLIDIAEIDEMPSTYHLGFILGPRINAGGRVGESELGSQLLSTKNTQYANEIAQKLERYNRERQAIEQMVLEQAENQINEQIATNNGEVPEIIFAYEHGWHEGVIGIVAGRIKEKYNRPTAIITINNDENGLAKGKASARSIIGVDLGAAITAARQEGLLLAGGGHAMAAGFSVAEERIGDLHKFLCEYMQAAVVIYGAERSLNIDASIYVQAANEELLEKISQLEPYGQQNSEPRFLLSRVRIIRSNILKDEHVSIMVTDADQASNASIKAIAFRVMGKPLGEILTKQGAVINLVGKLKMNYWQGRSSVQMIIDDAMSL